MTLLRENGDCVIAIKTMPDKINKIEGITAKGKEESLVILSGKRIQWELIGKRMQLSRLSRLL